MTDTLTPRSLAAVGAELSQRPYARRGTAPADVPIRVLLVDDHALFRAGLKMLLHPVADIQVIGEAKNGTEVSGLIGRLHPDVIVMDLDMPGMDGLTATRDIVDAGLGPRVLVLSMHSEEEQLLPLLEAGASGFLTKEAAESELVEAIRVVAAGDTFVRPRVARMLANHERMRSRTTRPPQLVAFEALSARERTVVELTARGYGGVEIGQQLGISNKTVETYKERIEEKLGLRHRTDYVKFALEAGLLHR